MADSVDLDKVLIVEDSEDVVEAVSIALRIRWPQVTILSADRGEEAIRLAETGAPDIIILDLGLPDISGFDVLKSIRLFSSVPIIILTVRGEEKDVVKGLELGADEYIVKPFRQLELMARVQALTRRKCLEPAAQQVTVGSLSLDMNRYTANNGEKQARLTATEATILASLMKQPGLVVTHAHLADDLWGRDYSGSAAALKIHVRRLRQKIESDPGHPKVILTQRGLGYFLSKQT